MPGLKHGVYLNTAGIGQSPVSVNEGRRRGLSAVARRQCQYEGLVRRNDRGPQTNCRPKLPGFFGADAGEIALTMSTGEGYGMVLGGLRWQPGDEGPHHQ